MTRVLLIGPVFAICLSRVVSMVTFHFKRNAHYPPTIFHSRCCVGTCSDQHCSLIAPYMCPTGKEVYGCSPNSTYWPSSPTACESCCTVKSCEFSCTPCTAEHFCDPSWDEYMCTAGPYECGCDGNPSYFREQWQCYSCCDSNARMNSTTTK
ncbi:Hypothetical protein, putative [Bodo saltans]|uniref:Membrane-associated protein n=1 Tax=Bodo saltans TaxID=75058 RepID=A0A0S4J2Z6_BODSA|nr:Hypothetical protein, putative [Bodo saltans]|eukprot:CUG72231.1 Hypothetical protein, putative [Bodo saltans]